MGQAIICGNESYKQIKEILQKLQSKTVLLVCKSSLLYLHLEEYFNSIGISFVQFNDFTSNPLYEDVRKGVELFNSHRCDAIVAVGGGSTIDVAKCIKLYSKMDGAYNYLEQEYKNSGVPLIAAPTTAGTGSESTRYAVIYYKGRKQSVTHDSIVPDYAVLDPHFLTMLPLYQKKCTMLDALCQGIESWWSVNSTQESKEYSKIAVETIMEHMGAYIQDNSYEAAERIMLAANYAGRAINITQTTAPHAMSYKLTSMYNLPHGHAVALCLPEVWEYMLANTEKCLDKRGTEYLNSVFSDIAKSLGCDIPKAAVCVFRDLVYHLAMIYPQANDRKTEIEILTNSVNPVRLGNNPVELSEAVFRQMYERIVQAS